MLKLENGEKRVFRQKEFFTFEGTNTTSPVGYDGERMLATTLTSLIGGERPLAVLTANHDEIYFDDTMLYSVINAGYDVLMLDNGDLKGSEKEFLCRNLCAFPLSIEKLSPPEKAMAMSGGVSLKEINPATMGSRLVKGLFFAGEITNLTGPCGGFNIQYALSSGYLAGTSPSPRCFR